MTDNADKPPKRPNANYKLSKPDPSPDEPLLDEKEPLKFHYDREARLEKAPLNVQDLYVEKKPHSRFNLIGPLVSDKPKTLLFLTILILCVAILVLSIFNFRFDGSYMLEGNRLEISGTRFEGATIIVLRKSVPRNAPSPWAGAVEIAVFPPVDEDEDVSVFYHRVFFTHEQVEEYRFAVPFDSPELFMVLQTERSSLRIRLRTN